MNSITTPDTALKKAFKTETFVISTAATVEKTFSIFSFPNKHLQNFSFLYISKGF